MKTDEGGHFAAEFPIKKSLAIIKGLAMGVASSEIATIINAALGVLQ